MQRRAISLAALVLCLAGALPAQAPSAVNQDSLRAVRWRIENELQSLAVVERKVMIPMRDGIRIQADIYYPKDGGQKYPAIWVRTPYNFNWWDIKIGRAHV